MSGPGRPPVSLRDDVPQPQPEAAAPSRPADPYRRRRLAVVLIAAALALVGGAAWALLGSGLFAVRSIVITGTRLVPDSQVLAAADVRPGTPIIDVHAGQVAARVLKLKQLIGVEVTTSWPSRVVITVRERTSAVAVALPGGGFDLVDSNGVVVQQVRTRPSGLPLLATTTAGSALAGNPDVASIAAVLGELPASLRRSVSTVSAPAPEQVTLQLSSGVTVVWGGADRAAAKAQELTALMATHARYYDVSSPDSAVTGTSSSSGSSSS